MSDATSGASASSAWSIRPSATDWGENVAMAFGQQAGPPATARQVQELLALLHHAGHTDFRDARGPMGFTQRQAAGKFTRDEAEYSAMIRAALAG